MSTSDRLAQEDRILHEIRLALSAVSTLSSPTPSRRRGTIYASAPITSGLILYSEMQRHGFVSSAEFRRAMPDVFKKEVLKKNLALGQHFGEYLASIGWVSVIVPGKFFANGWTQEHYMSLWRQVITRHARIVALGPDWAWSLGCTEEFTIAAQQRKKILNQHGQPLRHQECLDLIRKTMDRIDEMGFDIKPHYELWRLGTLTVEAFQDSK